MQPITVKFCVQEPKSYLNYHLSTFKVDTSVNFPIQIAKEVMNLSKKEKKRYEKIVKSFVATAISFLSLSSKSMASELNKPTTQHVISANIPSELVEPLMELIGLAIGGSILLTIILLISAGILRQFRKKKESIEWSNDILRGFLQILIATPLVFILYYVTMLLLGNFTQFLKPF